MRRRDLGVGQVAASARRSPASRSSSACSRRQSASAAASRGDSGLGGRGGGLDLRRLLGLELLGRPARRARRRRPAPSVKQRRLRRRPARRLGGAAPCSHWRSTVSPVDLEAAGERLDRGEQPLLQADDEQPGRGLRPAASSRRSAPRARVRYSSSRRDSTSSGASSGRPSIAIAHDVALREAALDLADVLLEPADHHVLERLLAAHLDAAGEAVRVEQLEQRREAVRVAVVRRGREEEAVLEAAGRGRGPRA